MTPEEHAKIWRRAAQVVRAMDQRYAQLAASAPDPHRMHIITKQDEMRDAWGPAYQAAAFVLDKIAEEYER